MLEKYSCYAGIDAKYFTAFEKLWGTYSTQLPELDAVLQDNTSVKATVFYLWVNYYSIDGIIFLKPESIMLNSNVEGLVNKLQKYVPYEIAEAINYQRSSEVFMFLYVYHVAKCVYQHLADFVQMHEMLKTYPTNYSRLYTMKDEDFEPNDTVYIILKIINFEFIQMYLTQNRCYELHQMALYFTKSFINHEVSATRFIR